MISGPARRATFRAIDDSTAEDWAIIRAADGRSDQALPERILTLLQGLHEAGTALPVSRFEHSLQAATRALKAGETEPYVIAALLHDLGEPYFPENHAEFAAALLRPYVDERVHFILRHHALFQGYHFWHVLGGDRHARDLWRGHPFFPATAEFCARYDAPAFDAAYESLPLETFVPLLQRVLAAPRPGFDEHRASLWRRAVRRLYRLGRELSGGA